MQKFGRLGIMFFVILLCLFHIPTLGQNKKVFVVTGKIDPEVKTSDIGNIEISKSGAAPTNIEIPKNGRFKLELDYFSEYTLTFSLPGHFSKIIIVSTDIPEEVWQRNSNFPPFPMIVQLFKEIEGIDKSFTLKPSKKLYYNKQTDNFDKEIIFEDTKVADQIITATSQSAQVKKETGTITKQEAQDLAVKQKNYDQTIKEADEIFKRGDFAAALLKYKEAQKLFPEKVYANDRFGEIENLMKALDNSYQEAMAKGDKAFTESDFYTAKTSYQTALTNKASDPIAKEKLEKTEAKLAELAKLNLAYNTAINAANKLTGDKQYKNAIDKYQEALQYVPDSDYPKLQIEKLDQLLTQGETERRKEELYAAKVKEGEALLSNKDYPTARSTFVMAYEIKPSEPLPGRRVKEIDKIMNDLALAEAKNKAIESAYMESIKRADQAFASKDFNPARLSYNEALTIKPNEQYPKDQIAKIDFLLKELASAEESNRLYAKSVKTAEEAFGQDKLKEARDAYQKAQDYKPSEPVPPIRIKEIDSMIAQLAETARLSAQEEARRLSTEKATKDQYDKAIVAADKAFVLKQYVVSRTNYSTALSISPNEQYPKDQISKIDALMNKQEEARLLSKVQAKKDSTNKANDLAYNQLLSSAKELLPSKQYLVAIGKYNEALAIKPNEQYPKDQIAKIDALQKELASVEETNRLYGESVKTAEEAFGQGKLKEARNAYQKALDYKPSEPMPPLRIKEIDSMIVQLDESTRLIAMEAAQRLAKEKATKDQYDKAIVAADKAFASKQYVVAHTGYSTASSILANEQYPKDQISKIDELMAAIEVKNSLADLPKVEIKTALNPVETEKAIEIRAQSFQGVNNYDEAIKKADDAFGIKDYIVARFYYYTANDLNPKEKYPNNQIELIRKLVDAQLSAIDRSGYELAITQADEAFKTKNYTQSKFLYNKALGIKSWEKYPKDQLEEILALTNSLLSEKEEKEYHNLIAKGDEALAVKDKSVARYYYNKAMVIKNDDNYLKIKMKDIQKLIDQDLLEGRNLEYNKLVEQADKAMQSEDFNLARFNYNKALNLKPEEKYPKAQLKLIKETLVKPKK